MAAKGQRSPDCAVLRQTRQPRGFRCCRVLMYPRALRVLRVPSSDALEDRGEALAAADAHRDERVLAAGALELVQGLDGQDGPGGGNGMPEGDAAAVRGGALGRQVQ